MGYSFTQSPTIETNAIKPTKASKQKIKEIEVKPSQLDYYTVVVSRHEQVCGTRLIGRVSHVVIGIDKTWHLVIREEYTSVLTNECDINIATKSFIADSQTWLSEKYPTKFVQTVTEGIK